MKDEVIEKLKELAYAKHRIAKTEHEILVLKRDIKAALLKRFKECEGDDFDE